MCRPLLLAAITFLSSLAIATATDFHLTPEGAGKKTGASWADALDRSVLADAVNSLLKPGDRLLIGSGIYPDAVLRISTGGESNRPKIVEGVARGGGGLPVFESTWSLDAPTKGAIAVRIEPGVSHVTLRGLRIKGYQQGVQALDGKGPAARTHLVFDDVDIEQMRHGFYLGDCDDLLLTGCDLKRYSKHGFRFDGGCDRVTLRQCTADCSEGDAVWETKTEALPFGFTVNNQGAPNTAFVFEDCLARNNMMPLQKGKYKNGDGFVVEGSAENVVFRRCRAIRNQDGGYDLKVAGVQLTDCVAIGNKRNFRIWTTGTLTNCFSGWADLGVWCNGGPLTVERSTFHDLRGAAAASDDRTTAPITLRDCLISTSAQAPASEPKRGMVALENTVVVGPKHPGKDPAYPRPDPSWDGLGEAMDSRAYPEKGYRHRPPGAQR